MALQQVAQWRQGRYDLPPPLIFLQPQWTRGDPEPKPAPGRVARAELFLCPKWLYREMTSLLSKSSRRGSH